MQTGVLLRDELERAGFAGPARERQMPKAYFEAHIEQGPVLEQAGLPIGVVTGVQGIYELDVTVTGFESHAGTTPMSVRRDAMGAAAAMIAAIVEHGHTFDADARVTVGHVAPAEFAEHDSGQGPVQRRRASRPALQQLVADIEAICMQRTAARHERAGADDRRIRAGGVRCGMRRACAAGNGGRRLSVHGDVQRRGARRGEPVVRRAFRDGVRAVQGRLEPQRSGRGRSGASRARRIGAGEPAGRLRALAACEGGVATPPQA